MYEVIEEEMLKLGKADRIFAVDYMLRHFTTWSCLEEGYAYWPDVSRKLKQNAERIKLEGEKAALRREKMRRNKLAEVDLSECDSIYVNGKTFFLVEADEE